MTDLQNSTNKSNLLLIVGDLGFVRVRPRPTTLAGSVIQSSVLQGLSPIGPISDRYLDGGKKVGHLSALNINPTNTERILSNFWSVGMYSTSQTLNCKSLANISPTRRLTLEKIYSLLSYSFHPEHSTVTRDPSSIQKCVVY